MPLNVGTGNTRPYAKYNSKSDKWFAPGDQEIGRPTFVADFPNLITGWFRFAEGQAPERLIDPAIDCAAPKPGDNFKRGFVVTVYSQQYFGGAVEFSSSSMHLSAAISDMYAAWEAQRAEHPGELPVITCVGSTAVKNTYGINYRPILTLSKWTPRPAELPDQSPVNPADIWRGADLLTPAPRPAPPPLPAPRTRTDELATEF